MKFNELGIKGVFLIEIEKIIDERGFFARTWDRKKFLENNLNSDLVQCNISFNSKKGTIRGIHFQKKPYEEAKLVHCTKGKVFEVILDIREDSPTFHNWISVELNEKDYKMLYVPEGFALGFQTLEDNTELFYQMSREYNSEYAAGLRWDDPKFKITWPLNVSKISKRDKSFTFVDN